MSSVKIGIIGGSGLDNPDILEGREEKFVNTPFGEPSDVLVEGKIKGVDCVLLARHGRKHEIMPSNINFRANVHALKHKGCTHLVVTTACGSLQEHVKPGDMLFPDQFIDRTQKRIQTFYDATCDSYKGVSHIPMHTPFCEKTRKILIESTQQLGIVHHSTGTVLTIEGPRFSSKAESKLWKSWGADIINMTTVPEVVLAKEAGLSYAAIGMVTDYDSWHDDEDPVSVDLVLATFKTNAERAQKILLHAIPKIAQEDWTAIIQENKAVAISSIM